MTPPSPVIIAQAAVQRLPRVALLLFCLAYLLPGFIGRAPWKVEDIVGFGVMRELAAHPSGWLDPQLMGQANGFDALLPYWLGAASIRLLQWLDPAIAVRLPFMLLLAGTMAATWYATYHLAQNRQAQPVAFAFGGEANAVDYARAMSDAALLALIACLGLAQLSHETTPALVQLGCTALALHAMAIGPERQSNGIMGPASALGTALIGLALSGAPTLAVLLGLGGAAIDLMTPRSTSLLMGNVSRPARLSSGKRLQWVTVIAFSTLAAALVAYGFDLWRWRIQLPGSDGRVFLADWQRLGQLLLWFTWPVWPLAMWTVWRWRQQLGSRHLLLPLWFAGVAIGATLSTPAAERSLMLSLPPLAVLAAFALPTFKRSVASLIDWFTLLFFSGCALIVWVVWIAMQTGFPPQPAANVARLVPGFVPTFSLLALVTALLASAAWTWLVLWRARAQRSVIWKSLVLPAAGATLCWLLLMTLWLPLLDYARSLAPFSRQVTKLIGTPSCLEIYGIDSAHAVALQYHGHVAVRQASRHAACPSLLVAASAKATLAKAVNIEDWVLKAQDFAPKDRNADVLLFVRKNPAAEASQ